MVDFRRSGDDTAEMAHRRWRGGDGAAEMAEVEVAPELAEAAKMYEAGAAVIAIAVAESKDVAEATKAAVEKAAVGVAVAAREAMAAA